MESSLYDDLDMSTRTSIDIYTRLEEDLVQTADYLLGDCQSRT